MLLRDQYWASIMNRSLRKQPIFRGPTTHFPFVWETRAEIPYWWRITTQIWVELLICRAAWKICFSPTRSTRVLSSQPPNWSSWKNAKYWVSGKQAISFLRLTRIYFHYFWVVIFCSIFYTWQVAANCKHAKSNNTEYYRHCAGRQQFIAISKWWCLSPKVF